MAIMSLPCRRVHVLHAACLQKGSCMAAAAINREYSLPLLLSALPDAGWQGEGWIVNICDFEATHTGPHHPAYAATKYALRGFSKSSYEVGG